MAVSYKPNCYLKYQELTDLLKSWAQQFPQLMTLQSIGKSREGREIWLVTVTESATGSPEQKPGYWIDGNIHAMEVAGTQASVHLLHKLLSGHKKDARLQRILETYSLYFIPRVSPDGAEYALEHDGLNRSVPVFYPVEQPLPGFYREDINGDGKMLAMLIPDRAGMYKKSRKDPRVVLRRRPHENDPGETYYRALPEGRCRGQGSGSKVTRQPFGHDYNRNFPDRWETEGSQSGAGEFPLSNPETRAMAEALSERPNIFGVMSFHTFSAIILRPPIHGDASQMNPLDLRTYTSMGEIGEEVTGYPCISISQDFSYERSRSITGSFTGWAYESRGVYAFATEIWHLAKAAGIEIKPGEHMRWLYDDLSEDDQIKMLQWCDNNLDSGTYFSEWKSFEHPDFGPVELGGYDSLFTVSNPPAKVLEAEVEKNAEMVLRLIECGPDIVISKKEVRSYGQGENGPVSLIELEVENRGFLSTVGAQSSLKSKATNSPRAQAKFSEGLKLLEGELDCEIPHLLGRADTEIVRNPLWANVGHTWDSYKHQHRLAWIVEGKGVVDVDLNLARGGKKRVRFEV